MNSSPMVSIIMPCYNSEEFVAEAVQSLLDQTYQHCEIIVIDDGSTDSSIEILHSFGDKIRWETGPNQGACAARNRGFELSSGDYIKFFDADDVLLPRAIELQVEQMQKLPSHAVPFGVGLDLVVQDEEYINLVHTSADTTMDDMIYECFSKNISTPLPLHRRELLKKASGFDQRIKRGQEWTFHLNLALSGTIFVYFPEPIYLHRVHDSPDRITNSATRRTTYDMACSSRVVNSKSIIDYYGKELPDRMKEAIYVLLLEDYRDLIRLNLLDDAQKLLSFSKPFAVNSNKIGGYPYRFLLWLFGAYFTEKLRGYVKSMMN